MHKDTTDLTQGDVIITRSGCEVYVEAVTIQKRSVVVLTSDYGTMNLPKDVRVVVKGD